jgi:hypothetical protein
MVSLPIIIIIIPGKHEIKEIQTQPHTAESANVKVRSLFHGRNNIGCNKNFKYRTAATLYTWETRFVSGM